MRRILVSALFLERVRPVQPWPTRSSFFPAPSRRTSAPMGERQFKLNRRATRRPAALCRAQSASIWRRLRRAPVRRRGAASLQRRVPTSRRSLIGPVASGGAGHTQYAGLELCALGIWQHGASAGRSKVRPSGRGLSRRREAGHHRRRHAQSLSLPGGGGRRPCATASASAVRVSPGPA